MQHEKRILTADSSQQNGDRHTLAQQVLGGILDAVRKGSEIQTRIEEYRR